MTGTLYIVATPMGNLEDITFRAVRILKEADLIAAEDTRHSRNLLNHYQISTPLTPCHEHNEPQRIADLIDKLRSGQSIALISDAGTPLISDPGFKLVREVARESIPVVPVPGCNAAVTALSASGLPTDSFLFLGFPPRKQGALTRLLQDLEGNFATLVFYESPKRILKLLQTAMDTLGDRNASLGRELTKIHEEFLRGPLSQLIASLQDRAAVKGECVLMVEGQVKQSGEVSREELEAAIIEGLESTSKTSALAGMLSRRFNRPKREMYEAIVKLKQ